MLVKDAAAKAAQDVLDAHWDGVYPVDLARIADGMGIGVRVTDLPDGTSGVIMKKQGEDAQILIDRSDHPARQRFTTAHEIGHFIERTTIQRDPDEDFGFVDVRTRDKYDLHEFFADEFAANLLMPESMVRKFHNEEMGVIAMSARLGVSPAAMRFRLKKLGIS